MTLETYSYIGSIHAVWRTFVQRLIQRKKKTRNNFKAMILNKLAIFIPYGTDFWWDFSLITTRTAYPPK